jgi:hypothetical protein
MPGYVADRRTLALGGLRGECAQEKEPRAKRLDAFLEKGHYDQRE